MSELPRPPGSSETRVDLSHIDALEDTARATDEFQVHAKDLVGRLFVVLKLARLYDLSNAAIPGPVARVIEGIKCVAGDSGGTVSLQLLPEGIFVNRVLLEPDEAITGQTHFLYATFQPLGVGEILFLAGVTESAVIELLAAVQRATQGRDEETGDRSLNGEQFGQIRLRSSTPEQTREAMERIEKQRAARVHAVASGVLRHFLAQLRTGKHAPLSTPKRLVQDLVDVLGNQAGVLFALSNDPANPHDLTDHLIGSALIALLMSARLQLPPAERVRVGLAALLHEIGDPGVNEDPWTTDAGRQSAQLNLLANFRMLLPCRGRSNVAIERLLVAYEHGPISSEIAKLPFGSGPAALIVAAAHVQDALSRPGQRRFGLLPDEAVRTTFHHFTALGRADIAALLVCTLGLYPPGSVVETSHGMGVIAEAPRPGCAADRPTVRLLTANDGRWQVGRTVDLARYPEAAIEITRCLDPAGLGLNPAAALLDPAADAVDDSPTG